MNNKKTDALVLWKHIEDVLVPALRLSHFDHSVYSLLLRHTVLEGQSRLRVSMNWLARASFLTAMTARRSVRRLVAKGVFRLVERSRDGHLIEVLDPLLIRPPLGPDVPAPLSGPAVIRRRRAGDPASASPSHFPSLSLRGTGALRLNAPNPDLGGSGSSTDIERLDFLSTPALREAIYKRDRQLCFYCLRRLKSRTRCLDHVVPQLRSGGNSYRNLVACCLECNSHKRDKSAADFLRSLYRERRLTTAEFNAGLHTLQALAAGQLRPILPT